MVVGAKEQDFHSLVLSCNKDGMDSLRQGQSKAAFEQFKYAEAILIANQSDGDNTSLLAVTCNNLGCYYKKVGKLHGALSYLRRALKMEVDLNTDEVTLAGTHLNICAILSKLEKHDKAVQHALCALELINQRLSNTEPDKISQDDYSVLAIAYHNVAVERDLMGEFEKAATAFQQGFQVAKRCLGEDHPLAVTLGKNSEAVLQKSAKLSKSPPRSLRSPQRGGDAPKDAKDDGGLPSLPPLPNYPASKDATMPMPQNTVRQGAMDWVAGEQTAFTSFAEKVLGGSTASSSMGAPGDRTQEMQTPRRAGEALQESQSRDLKDPVFGSPSTYRDIPFASANNTLAPFALAKKSPLTKALDDYPEALMDIIDADRTGHTMNTTRSAPHDYRPNRMMKGATRTARVVRRTGVFNSTRHRDHIMTSREMPVTSVQKGAYVQKIAAEKIQRAWRAWYRYCQDNADWMTTTWICATMIQAKWRSYHVRRVKLDRAALTIQRHVRGHVVRKVLKKHRAAVVIQRHAVGMLTRKQLRRLHCAAVKMQSLIRGFLARRRVRRRRLLLTTTAIKIQCAWRSRMARKKIRNVRAARDLQARRQKAALDIQRCQRGKKGREKAAAAKRQYHINRKEFDAATKMQAMVRRDMAIKRVDKMRAEKLAAMNKAATFMRKMWLGAKTRRRYKELLGEFTRHLDRIVTIQRYARGFIVRLRMWREAIRAEEELWATLEIQRIYRGYQGRVKWEHKFETVWRREMAAATISRHLRGWLARTRVNRMRRRIARQEFEHARLRFRSAQRVQALARGVLTRRVTKARHARAVRAAVSIQRIARGHALRKRLWKQVLELRCTMIQAAARGFLVRNRRFHLICKVICIQRAWRKHLEKPEEVRREAFNQMQIRKKKAAVIQGHVRKRQEEKNVQRIQEEQAQQSKK